MIFEFHRACTMPTLRFDPDVQATLDGSDSIGARWQPHTIVLLGLICTCRSHDVTALLLERTFVVDYSTACSSIESDQRLSTVALLLRWSSE